MVCKNCNAKNIEGIDRCIYCGASLTENSTGTSVSELAGVVRSTVASCLKSGLFIGGAILLTIGAVFKLQEGHTAGLTESIDDMINADRSMEMFINIMGAVPYLIAAVGLWILVISALRHKEDLSPLGMKVTTVAGYFSAAPLAIILFLAIIELLHIEEGTRAYEKTNLVMAWMMVLLLMSVTVLLTTMNVIAMTRVRMTIENGVPNSKVPGFVGVMCFISAGSMVYALMDKLTFSNVFLGGALLMFGFEFFIYKKKMRQLESKYLSAA